MSLIWCRSSVRFMLACLAGASAIGFMGGSRLLAQEEKKLNLCIPEGKVLRYKISRQLSQNWGGSDVSMNQSAEVDLSLHTKTDTLCKVSLKYSKPSASLVANNQLQEWSPPVKLEGAVFFALVRPDGFLDSVELGSNIQGLSGRGDVELREYVEDWFIKYPDLVLKPGLTWNEEIVKGVQEGKQPAIKGTISWAVKKFEKKGNIEVAILEGKFAADINQETPAGMLVAKAKGKIDAAVALEGGYIVSAKRSVDIKGETVSKDELSGRETRRETYVTQSFEAKLLE